MANVPTGSVLIDPQTLQPFTNQDGYVFIKNTRYWHSENAQWRELNKPHYVMQTKKLQWPSNPFRRSIYHFDPSNLPANQEQSFAQYIKKPLSRKKLEKQKSIRDGQSSRIENGPAAELPNANPPPKINTVNEMDDNTQSIENVVPENGLVIGKYHNYDIFANKIWFNYFFFTT